MQTQPVLVAFLRHPAMQETERVYSFNPGARTGYGIVYLSNISSSSSSSSLIKTDKPLLNIRKIEMSS